MTPQTSELPTSLIESPPTSQERVVLRPRTSVFEKFATDGTTVSEISEIRTQKDAIAQFGPLDGKHEYIPNKDGVFDGNYGTIQVAGEIVKQRTEEQIGNRAPENVTPVETMTAPIVSDEPKTVGDTSIETTSSKDDEAISNALTALLDKRTGEAISHAQASIDTPLVSQAPVIEEVKDAPVVDNVLTTTLPIVEAAVTTTETVTPVIELQAETKPNDEATHVIPIQVIAPQAPVVPQVPLAPLAPIAPLTPITPLAPIAPTVGEKEAAQQAELTLLRAKNMILEINPHLEADLIEIFGNIPEISYTKDLVLPKLNPKAYLDLQQQTVETIVSQQEVVGNVEHKNFAALLQHYITDSETPTLPQETAHDYLLRLSKKVEELTKGNPPQGV